jgi:uncharacterized protein (TIGR03435 family)
MRNSRRDIIQQGSPMTTLRYLCFTVLVGAAFGQGALVRAQFEVCSVKPSPPQSAGEMNVGVRVDGAQVHVSSLSLRDLIRSAFRVKLDQIAGPAWLGGARYDVDAKLPDGATRAQVPDMLRSMLDDRFGLKTHMEPREIAVYGLIAAGQLRLKEAPEDPGAAGKPLEVNAGGNSSGGSFSLGNGSNFAISAKGIEGQRLSMDDFTNTLSRFMDLPVLDMTGLKGRYDFSFPLSLEDYRSMQIRAAIGAGISLPAEAMRALPLGNGDSLHSGLRDLGLRLEPRKAAVEMLVVDHVEKTPTGN